MMHKWRFLTGSLPELKRVWRAYGIEAAVVKGTIDHTPATYVIDPHGRESRLFLTADGLLERRTSSGTSSRRASPRCSPATRGCTARSRWHRSVSLGPQQRVTLPRAGGGSVRLGPGSGAHLVLFFDTWESEVTDLAEQLDALNRYQVGGSAEGASAARRDRRGRGRAVAPGAVAVPARPASPALVSGRHRPQRHRCRRLPRAGLALARARLGQGSLPLLRGLAVKGWPTLKQLLAQVRVAQTK